MNVNDRLRYKELVGNNIQLTNHFRMRYKERVSKGSGRALDYTKKAYAFGVDVDGVDDKKRRESLEKRLHDGTICKIYRGFVFIFKINKAITVFPISHIKSLKKEHAI